MAGMIAQIPGRFKANYTSDGHTTGGADGSKSPGDRVETIPASGEHRKIFNA